MGAGNGAFGRKPWLQFLRVSLVSPIGQTKPPKILLGQITAGK